MDELEYCTGCDDKHPCSEMTDFNGHSLCNECFEKYDNKTGHCSLDCCLGGACDDSC